MAIGCACIEFFHTICNDEVLGYEFNEDSALSFMYKDQKSENYEKHMFNFLLPVVIYWILY